ncbi:MAG: PAS domain-containing sensor histidine kinase, partial [Ginsengibacter sp.]
ASGYDVTEEVISKRNSKQQLLNQQAYDLFMQAPVGFSLLLGDDHRIELVNHTALEFTGKNEDCIGKPVTEILPEVQMQGFSKFLDQVRQTGQSIHLKESKVMLDRNGIIEKIYLNIYFQPYYKGGKIMGILTIMSDVTDQVLSRKNAEELKERFETMANNIPNLAWISDADGSISWYNDRWYEFTGTTKEQVDGWGWQSFHDPKRLPSVIERWEKCIATKEPFEMVFPLRAADGSFRQFLTRAAPIRDKEGKVIQWLGTNTDITKQKEMERMKDDFMSMASHELKTPLTTIKAYTQIVEMNLREKNDVDSLALMKRMNSQVNKLTTLIEDLLDVTKMQKGKLVYNENFFDFNDLVREVIDYMQKTSGSHKIKIQLTGDITIFGDNNKISQVIDNLISNAIKYSPGANEIIVSTEIRDDGAVLSVQDFGIGILAKDRKKIFTQFYRVSDERQITFPGMGIGLYICTEIINRQGGKIWVESKIGKGSTFYVWLPFDHRNVVEPNV